MGDVLPVLRYPKSQFYALYTCKYHMIGVLHPPSSAILLGQILLGFLRLLQKSSLFLKNVGPRAPANIQVSFDSGSLKAYVSWAPTEGAFNYTVMALSDSSRLSCSTTFSSCTISSLQCGTEYLISVLATNDAGSSRSISAVTLRTGM